MKKAISSLQFHYDKVLSDRHAKKVKEPNLTLKVKVKIKDIIQMSKQKRKRLIDMNSAEARAFFLKSSSYVNVNLPKYFNFDSIIKEVAMKLSTRDLTDLSKSKKALSNNEKVNYTLLVNKGSDYAWRPLQILHPIVYVDLVNTITEEESWKKICDRFREFQHDSRIQCVSTPSESQTEKSDTAEAILNWWENLEQAQVHLALEFEYCILTDIANCYSSIYTHTIPWAIHTKAWAKEHRRTGIGNVIDSKISYLQHGQTNGIPQGSVLMDFIAEIVLGYVDLRLSHKLEELIKESKLSEYKILRYRDDYRVFSNSKEEAEIILRSLSQILFDVNLNLNANKTLLSTDIIQDAIKPDKIYWEMQYLTLYNLKDCKKEFKIGIQKHLLQIKILSDKYPNSGSVKRALTDFYKLRMYKLKKRPKDIYQIISVVTYIMSKNPNSVEHCTAILSKLFMFLTQNEANKVINSILSKFRKLPNTDYIEVWLQRLSIVYDREKPFNANLCQKVRDGNGNEIWNSDWLKEKLDESSIIDERYLSSMRTEILISEIDLFNNGY